MATTADPFNRREVGQQAAVANGVCWQGRVLDIAAWRLAQGTEGPGMAPDGPARSTLEQARDTAGAAGLRHLVVGVIGPRAASPAQECRAEELGRGLAGLGLTVICGGRSGVMEAVCRGVHAAGGLSIGILPGQDPDSANPFVGIPLPTGLNEGRNMVIARAARVLVAVGGSYGTLTEMAYGLHFGKTVIALDDAPDIAGLVRAATVEEALEMCCAALLRQAAEAGCAGPPEPGEAS